MGLLKSYINLLQNYHLKSNAQTGNPTPNISITFIGKSRPLEEVCKHTPRSAQAEIIY